MCDNVKYEWTVEQEKSFGDIKQAIVAATLMYYPDPLKPYVIVCDAALEGLGEVLHQVGKDN